jgi:predicted Zn-dependent protease
MMQGKWHWIGLGIVLGLSHWPAWSTDPDPEAVRRLMEKYRREAEAEKHPPAPKPVAKPAPKKPTVNYDREAWKSAEKCGTAACFEAYLANYPKGRYARMARARLKSASAPRTPAPTADLPPAEITREGSQSVVALLDSADKYVRSNQLDKAGAALERALRIEPRNAGIWHDLAQIRLHQGQYQQAESLANNSSSLAGGNRALQARNWRLMAAARKASGNTAGAEEAEARAAQLR